jgi:hypothetical protein
MLKPYYLYPTLYLRALLGWVFLVGGELYVLVDRLPGQQAVVLKYQLGVAARSGDGSIIETDSASKAALQPGDYAKQSCFTGTASA